MNQTNLVTLAIAWDDIFECGIDHYEYFKTRSPGGSKGGSGEGSGEGNGGNGGSGGSGGSGGNGGSTSGSGNGRSGGGGGSAMGQEGGSVTISFSYAYHNRTYPIFLNEPLMSQWHHYDITYLWHHSYITMTSLLHYDFILTSLLHYDVITRTL